MSMGTTRYVKRMCTKCFLINITLVLILLFVASIVTSCFHIKDASGWLEHIFFWWVTLLSIGNRKYRFYQEDHPNYILACFIFILVGYSFIASLVLNLCEGLKRTEQRSNKKRGKGVCFCCIKGTPTTHDEGVMFKDATTQKWGSLMSINNIDASAMELRSLGGGSSFQGGILENSNRVDSQCTIKRLSEIERERRRSGAGEDESNSDFENDADDELGILSPIMVTAAVATRRTVPEIN